MMENAAIGWNFGMLEAVLASIHDIAPAKRTAFQARLKNFHRLQFPVGFKMHKGKTSIYSAGDVMLMALAVELTQLGLSPESVVRTLTENWYPATMALKMSAASLVKERGVLMSSRWNDETDSLEETGALPMFLYFDPAVLSGLTNGMRGETARDFVRPSESFFYGGIGVLRDSIANWTSSDVNRLSLVNVTSLMSRIADESSKAGHAIYSTEVAQFFEAVEAWAEDFQERLFADVEQWANQLGEDGDNDEDEIGWVRRIIESKEPETGR